MSSDTPQPIPGGAASAKAAISKPKRATKAELETAVRRFRGSFTRIAKHLGISRQAVAKRVKADQHLMSILEDCRESMIDTAESALEKAVRNGKPWAVRFVLSTIGKSRGYSQLLKIDGDINQSGQVVLYLPDNGRDKNLNKDET